jgi:succinoglycan biosynthesis protein ExoA
MSGAQIAHARVIVAIPTLDEAAGIEAVVRSLAREKVRLPGLEIVVADGGSRDRTPQIVARLVEEMPFVHLIVNPARLQGAAVNLAARLWSARADVLVRCDAHALYPERYVERLLESLRRTRAASIVVPMDSTGSSCFQKAVAWVSDTPIGSGGAAHRGGHVSGFVDHGHHAAFRLAAFLAADGYDQSFTHNEDGELDCRLAAAGDAIYLDANIRITYYTRASAGALWRQAFLYGRGRSRTMRRHPGSIRLRQLAVLAHLMLFVFSVAAAAITGTSSWLTWPATYITLLAMVSLDLTVRKWSLCGLLAGPAAAIMHTAWACGVFSGLLFIRERVWSPRGSNVAQVMWTRASAGIVWTFPPHR